MGGLLRAFRLMVSLAGERSVQDAIVPTGIIKCAHWISESKGAGDLGVEAEKLLERVVAGNDVARGIVEEMEGRTKRRKREMAEKRRGEALEKMAAKARIPAGPGGPPSRGAGAPAQPAWMAEFADMGEDEDPIVCCTCGEGYSYDPASVLGMYTHSVRVSVQGLGMVEGNGLLRAHSPGGARKGRILAELRRFSSDSRAHSVWTTTSAGNVIHVSCHARAVKADRNHAKAPKSEWEGSTLRNSRCKCNAVLPLRKGPPGAAPPGEDLDRFFESASSATGVSCCSASAVVPRAQLSVHDFKILAEKMAGGANLAEHTQGGTVASNCHLLLRLVALSKGAVARAEAGGDAGPSRVRALPAAFVAAAGKAGAEAELELARASKFAACCAVVGEGGGKIWAANKAAFLQHICMDVGGVPGGKAGSWKEWGDADVGSKRARGEIASRFRNGAGFWLIINMLHERGVFGEDNMDDQDILDLSEDLGDFVTRIHKCGGMEELWGLGCGDCGISLEMLEKEEENHHVVEGDDEMW